MRRLIFLSLFFIFAVGIYQGFADRNSPDFAVKTTSALIKQGDWKVYRVDFIATGTNGSFAIYDQLVPQNASLIRTEGQEATAKQGNPYDFSDKPLEGSTGLYFVINSGTAVIQYE